MDSYEMRYISQVGELLLMDYPDIFTQSKVANCEIPELKGGLWLRTSSTYTVSLGDFSWPDLITWGNPETFVQRLKSYVDLSIIRHMPPDAFEDLIGLLLQLSFWEWRGQPGVPSKLTLCLFHIAMDNGPHMDDSWWFTEIGNCDSIVPWLR